MYRYMSWTALVLSRLPQPSAASVLGLVGANGTGKTTALKILSGKMKPNLGRYEVSDSSRKPKQSLSSVTQK